MKRSLHPQYTENFIERLFFFLLFHVGLMFSVILAAFKINTFFAAKQSIRWQ